MQSSQGEAEVTGKKSVWQLAWTSLALGLVLLSHGVAAQDTKPDAQRPQQIYRTFYLTHATGQREQIDVQTLLRNMLPSARIFNVAAERAICVEANAADLETAEKILADVDRPRSTYRLTYTITQTDGEQRINAQHVSLLAVTGEEAVLKQGNRMPLVTGSTDSSTHAPSSQVQYIDLGLNMNARVDGSPDLLQLRSKVEQSAVADEKSGIGAQDPVIHQTTLEATVSLKPGQTVVLGTLGIPGTTRQEQIAVEAQAVEQQR